MARSNSFGKIQGSWGSQKGISNTAFVGDDQDGLAKQRNLFDIDMMTEVEIKDEKRLILKNILLISIAFLFNFNGFRGLSRLQSSLHRDEGMGTTNSAVLYASLMLSCLIVPKFVMDYLGYKWTMPLAFIGYIIWMAANGYAVWGTMVTASILVGLCAAPLWTAQKSYFRIAAGRYAKLAKQDGDSMVALFVGLFYCFYAISSIAGSIVSSTVLQQDVQEIDEEVLESCGVNDCPGNNASNPYAEDPPESTVWLMLGIYIGIAVLGALILAVFVDELPAYLKPKKEEHLGKDSLKLLASTGRHLKYPKQLALIPLTMYTGFEQATFNAEFTKSFVTCSMGIWQVGYVTIPFGIMNALTALASGRIAKYTGRMPLFTAGFVVDYIIQIVLITWMPTPKEYYVMYILAVMWGFSDAMWQTQLNAIYGVLFPDPVPAYANINLWTSFGLVIAYAYSGSLCTDVKLYILISMLTLAAIGYYITEFLDRHDQSKVANLADKSANLPISTISNDVFFEGNVIATQL